LRPFGAHRAPLQGFCRGLNSCISWSPSDFRFQHFSFCLPSLNQSASWHAILWSAAVPAAAVGSGKAPLTRTPKWEWRLFESEASMPCCAKAVLKHTQSKRWREV
jgi:hypothetical protein